MTSHPVRLHVEPPARLARIHVLIRLALLIGIGTLGFSSIYWLLYLAVPALVAGYILQDGGEAYLAKAGPRLVPVLRWLAGAYAYLWLLTDVLPSAGPGGAVELEVEAGGRPTPAGALSRLLLSVPALVLAALLSLAAAIVWVVAAVAVLINERVPSAVADFLTMALRYQTRFVAYHLSLVDRYPSLDASAPVHAPA